MRKLKKIYVLGAMIFAMGATSITAFAASTYKTPAEAVAGLTGRTVESVMAERQESSKTYGEIAADAGKLEDFKKESIEIKKDHLKAQVEAGRITQEKADEMIKVIEENQVNCDGMGFNKAGKNKGARFGFGGLNQGQGKAGKGAGRGQGGMRLQDGSCTQ